MESEVEIIPAILTDNPVALERMVQRVSKFASYVQFDIMDGNFVPSKSITTEHLNRLEIGFHWEAHLMVNEPELYFAPMKRAGAKRVIFHFEATDVPNHVAREARELGLEVAVALNPYTPVSPVVPLLENLDGVLLLTVDPGYYGSPFLVDTLDRVKELRQAYPHLEIGVDGGIKENNIRDIVHKGVDRICVGSAIFFQLNPALAFHRLVALARS